jgi:hypothetical protein
MLRGDNSSRVNVCSGSGAAFVPLLADVCFAEKADISIDIDPSIYYVMVWSAQGSKAANPTIRTIRLWMVCFRTRGGMPESIGEILRSGRQRC